MLARCRRAILNKTFGSPVPNMGFVGREASCFKNSETASAPYREAKRTDNCTMSEWFACPVLNCAYTVDGNVRTAVTPRIRVHCGSRRVVNFRTPQPAHQPVRQTNACHKMHGGMVHRDLECQSIFV